MPKRKRENSDYDNLVKKIRKLERKVRRVKRRDRHSSSSDTHESRSDLEDLILQEPFEPIDDNNQMFLSNDVDKPPNAAVEMTIPPETVPQTSVSENQPSTSTAACSSATVSDPTVVAVASTQVEELDDVMKELLGDDPTLTKTFGDEMQKDLAIRFEHVAKNGLTKEARKELKEKYLIPSNCKLIDAPLLNPEIKAAVSEIVSKRDKAIETRQKQMAAGISCLSQALTKLLVSKDKDADLIKLLLDASRILCDTQHNDSITRRNFILSSLKKDMKDQLLNTKVDDMLFGQNLADTLKAAKAINKSGAELKAPTVKPQQANKKTPANISKSKNWKGPYQNHKQPDHQKSKESPSVKNRQWPSSKPSQNQPHHSQRQNRNRN